MAEDATAQFTEEGTILRTGESQALSSESLYPFIAPFLAAKAGDATLAMYLDYIPRIAVSGIVFPGESASLFISHNVFEVHAHMKFGEPYGVLRLRLRAGDIDQSLAACPLVTTWEDFTKLIEELPTAL